MPYPSQIDRPQIVAEARRLLETGGLEELSMSALARALGVRAPSLYRYVGGRDELLQALNLATLRRLMAALADERVESATEPAARLQNVAAAFRAFAHANPAAYVLAFTSSGARRPDEELLLQMALPLQQMMAEIAGEDDSLAALRGLLALVHGFVMLELNEQLQRGGDLGAAFRDSVAAYLRGWGQNSL